MGFIPDRIIRILPELITPCQPRNEVTRHGLSSCGYDVRLATVFLIPVQGNGIIFDRHSPMSMRYEHLTTEEIVISPGAYILGSSIEYIKMPRNLVGFIYNKSTYARMGIIVNGAPIEPEWEGQLTLCIANIGVNPVRLHAGDGIAQILFSSIDGLCEISYKDREGKYQRSIGPIGADQS